VAEKAYYSLTVWARTFDRHPKPIGVYYGNQVKPQSGTTAIGGNFSFAAIVIAT